MYCIWKYDVNSSLTRQNGRDFSGDIFRCIFINETFCILIRILLKFVPKGPIDNDPSLVKIMAWRRTGDKPLSEQCWHNSLKHICCTRGRWVKPYECIPYPVTFRSSRILHILRCDLLASGSLVQYIRAVRLVALLNSDYVNTNLT